MSGEIVTKAPGVQFKNVHPTPSAGRSFRGVDIPPSGSNDGRESKYVRCKQCGFICNRDRISIGSGWGNETTTPITTIAGGTANAVDPTVTAGCPFCGSSEFEG